MPRSIDFRFIMEIVLAIKAYFVEITRHKHTHTYIYVHKLAWLKINCYDNLNITPKIIQKYLLLWMMNTCAMDVRIWSWENQRGKSNSQYHTFFMSVYTHYTTQNSFSNTNTVMNIVRCQKLIRTHYCVPIRSSQCKCYYQKMPVFYKYGCAIAKFINPLFFRGYTIARSTKVCG